MMMILNKLVVRGFSKSPCQFRCSDKIKDLLENTATGEDMTPKTLQNDKKSRPQDTTTSPYPEKADFNNRFRDQSKKVGRSRQDPRSNSVILFPGQGSQYVGMAKDLIKIPEARNMFEIAKKVLGYDLLKICNEGPKEKLDKTIYAQPAIAVTSLASLEKLKRERPKAIDDCVVTAGFSLGEISALIFAGAIPFDQGIKLIKVRAEAMQIASNENPSGMATVIYGADSQLGPACVQAKEWCLEKGIENPECTIANYLFPHCKVIAGSLEALNFLEKNSKHFKLRRVKRLPVSGAFHTKLMESAVEPFKEALKKIRIEMPLINVHTNIDGKIYRTINQILHQLPTQIVKPVRWEQLLHIIYERKQGDLFPRTYECAPGKSLSTILEKVNAKAFESTFAVDREGSISPPPRLRSEQKEISS